MLRILGFPNGDFSGRPRIPADGFVGIACGTAEIAEEYCGGGQMR
jgi:hypothetical protein